MSGDAVCATLMLEPPATRPVIIVQTALTDDFTRDKLFSLGADDYFSKPLDPNELVTRCRMHLERRLSLRESEPRQSLLPGA